MNAMDLDNARHTLAPYKANLKRLFQRKPRGPLARATAESLLTAVAAQGALVVSGIFAARLLGVHGRGQFALVTAFTVIVAQLSAMGVPQAITYFTSKPSANSGDIYQVCRGLILLQLLVAVVAHYLVVVGYNAWISEAASSAFYITLAVSPCLILQQYGLSFLQGAGRFRLFNFLRFLPVVVNAVLLAILMIEGHATLLIIAGIWTLANTTCGIYTFMIARSSSVARQGLSRAPTATLSQVLSFGLRGMIGWASPLESFRVDQLMAGLLLSPASLGLYVVGQAFTNILKFIAQSAGMIAYPAISNAKNASHKHRIWLNFFGLVAVLDVCLAAVLIMVMPFILPFLFGNAFSPAVPIAQVLVVVGLFVALRRIVVELARGLGYPEISSYADLAIYPVLLLLSIPLMTFYGALGLAISLAVAQLGAFILAFSMAPPSRIKDWQET